MRLTGITDQFFFIGTIREKHQWIRDNYVCISIIILLSIFILNFNLKENLNVPNYNNNLPILTKAAGNQKNPI